MELQKPTPRSVVVAYFASFAIGWLALAITLAATGMKASPHDAIHHADDAGNAIREVLFLAAHATAIAVVAWKGGRWFFARGPLAVAAAALPLLPLIHQLWLVPAFFYVIAGVYVFMASRHESVGKLQAPPRRLRERAPI